MIDSTHDPLCPRPLCDYGQPQGDCAGYEDCVHDCQCPLIAKVRADEREQAGLRVAALTSWTDDNSPLGPDRVCRYLSAVDAALGEEQ